MKILLANGTAYPTIGGVENSLNFIAQALLEQGHEVKIFCFRQSPDQPLRCVHKGIEIIRAEFTTAKRPDVRIRNAVKTAADAIDELIHDFAADEIWSRWSAIGLGAVRSSFQGTVKNIFPTTAGMDSTGLYLNTRGLPLFRRLLLLALWPLGYTSSIKVERELIEFCQPVVFSQLMSRELSRVHKDLNPNIAVIRPGVDSDFFSTENSTADIESIRNRYGIDQDRKYIVYVGRLAACKNITLLIDALHLLAPEVHLIIVGDGPENRRLKDYVRHRGLSERVVFAGSQSGHLPAFYRLARVSVLPTIVESFGQTYLESMSCGTPVVGFQSNGRKVKTATAEIIRHRKTGYIVRDISAAGLAHGIKQLLAMTDAEYSEMSHNAREDAKRRFSWPRFVDEMLAVNP